jgi:hypothetical protein
MSFAEKVWSTLISIRNALGIRARSDSARTVFQRDCRLGSTVFVSNSKFLEPLTTKYNLKSHHTKSTGTSMSGRDPPSLLLLLESEASSRIPIGSALGVIFFDSLISPTFLRYRSDEDPKPNFTMLKMIVKSIAKVLAVPISQRLVMLHSWSAIELCAAACTMHSIIRMVAYDSMQIQRAKSGVLF